MRNEIARYTFSYYEGNHRVPLFEATLKNIYRISTNFDNEQQLINFIKQYFKIDSPVEKLTVTYNEGMQLSINIIYSDARDIILNNLLEHIEKYISEYSNLIYLNINNMQNSFLREELKKIKDLGRGKASDYYRQIKIFMSILERSYKNTCDIANYINEHMKGAFLSTSSKQEHSYAEISEMIKSMNMHVFDKPQSVYNNPKVDSIINNSSAIQPNSTMSEAQKESLISRIYADEEEREHIPLEFKYEEKGKSR